MKGNLGYIGWALAGGALGAVVALLTAPASGRLTRERLARRIEDGKRGLQRRGHRASESAADLVAARPAVNG